MLYASLIRLGFQRVAFGRLRETVDARRAASVATPVVLAALLAGCGGGGGATSSLLPLGHGSTRNAAAVTVGTFGIVDAAGGSVSFAPLGLAWPKGAPAAGDLLVACTEAQWQSTPQAPAGWTTLYAGSANTFGSGLFYKIAGNAEPAAVSFSIPTPYNIGAAMVRIAGAASTAPQWSHAANKSSKTIATGAIVPAVLGALPLACVGGVNAGSYTAAAGWSVDAQAATGYIAAIGHRGTTASDTTTPISTTATAALVPTSSDAFGVIVAPGVAATPPPPPPPSNLAIADAASGSVSFAPLSLAWKKGAPASGDLLVACTEAQWQATPQTPAGWTALYAASTNSFGTALFYKIAGAGEPAAVTFTIPTPYNVSAAMVRITGAAASAPLWSYATNHGASTIATGALVPNTLGMLPLACLGGVNAGSYAFAAGWTLDTQIPSGYFTALAHRAATTTDTTSPISTTVTASATATNNDAYGVLVAPAKTGGSGALTANPASIAFTSPTAPAQAVVVTQAGTSTFSASTQNCTGIASISASGNGNFSVAPVGVGTCSFTITGSGGSTIALPVTTTSTVITFH